MAVQSMLYPYRHGKHAPLPPWLSQVAAFLLVGMADTAIDFGVYFLLTRGLLGAALTPEAAKAVSFCASTLNSFFMNRAFTFRSAAKVQSALPMFVLFNLIGLVFNTSILSFDLNVLSLPEWIALEMATFVSGLLNFTASKFLVFRKPTRSKFPRPPRSLIPSPLGEGRVRVCESVDSETQRAHLFRKSYNILNACVVDKRKVWQKAFWWWMTNPICAPWCAII